MADLCITIGAPTLAELRARRQQAEDQADFIELRLDTVADPDVAGALAGRRGRVIVTCRAAWEGGHFRGSEEERLRLLEEAWTAGADFVDVEWAARESAPWIARTHGERLIVSSHDFTGVPADLDSLHRAMQRWPADVAKIAITARRLSDTMPLAEIAQSASTRRRVLVAMGPAGAVDSRRPGRTPAPRGRLGSSRRRSCATSSGSAACRAARISMEWSLDRLAIPCLLRCTTPHFARRESTPCTCRSRLKMPTTS
jgi:3-dehydroquinate dehydratase-1